MSSQRWIANGLVLISLASVFSMSGCGPKAFTRGEYDDPNRVELLDDKYNEADMQQMSDTVINEVTSCAHVVNAPTPPVVIFDKINNRTEEHIDMVSLIDKIKTAMIKSGKVLFVNKEQRENIRAEHELAEKGDIDPKTAKKRKKQIAADYSLSGNLSTNIQQVGNEKFIYYKLTVNLTDMETNIIKCTAEKQIRKKYRKRSVGV